MFKTDEGFLGAFLTIGAILGFLFFALYDKYDLGEMFWLILINAIVIIILFVFIRLKYKNNRHNYFNKIMDNVTRVSREEEEFRIDENEEPQINEISIAIYQLQQNLKYQTQSKDNILKILNTLVITMDLQKLLNDLLPKLIEYSRSNCGAIYLYNSATDKFEIKTSLGFSKNIYKEFDITLGEGFMGRLIESKDIQVIKDIPENTVYINRTFIGTIIPKCIMSVPILNQNELIGIIVLTSVYNYTKEEMESIELTRYYIGIVINNCLSCERTQRLIKELEFQNQLLQSLNEELEKKTGKKI
jgi:transcriptional regulator with GAF, ATPase, and Fis domain